MIYYVGIDISKYKHDFCIISNTGEIIIENSSFENSKKGFQLLYKLLSLPNKIFTRQDLMDEIWGFETELLCQFD